VSNQNTEEVSGFEGSHDAMGCVQRTVKRLFDIVFSLAGMIILSPVYLVIAIMLKRQKNGPAIFSQERIGYRGKPFTIYKFRTMSEPEKEPQLVAKSSIGQSTKTELFLREHHLDELPQLWNVLKGDMSFVGPRPERRFYIDKIMANDPSYVLIYEMRPGLTSEATLYNGYTDTMEKMLIRLHMDTDYLKRRSLALDASIIAKTFISIVSGKKF
jgi:lipopolysaccharide/colanic/teichoic acid biosynthesis glycosyltransferase